MSVGVCVWMMAGLSSLTPQSLIGIWGCGRLCTCCTLSYLCAQDKPAVTTMEVLVTRHTQGEIHCHVSLATNVYNKVDLNTITLCSYSAEAQ